MKALAILILPALCLQACVSAGSDHDSPIRWRRATVLQFGTADSLGPPSDNDCRRKRAQTGEDPSKTFVVVQYFSGRTSVVQIVPLQPGETPAVGEPIEIRRFGCGDAHVPKPA